MIFPSQGRSLDNIADLLGNIKRYFVVTILITFLLPLTNAQIVGSKREGLFTTGRFLGLENATSIVYNTSVMSVIPNSSYAMCAYQCGGEYFTLPYTIENQ
jgi:hypothetical protein